MTDEYTVVTCEKNNPDSYQGMIKTYRIVINDGHAPELDKRLQFHYKQEADNVCDYLNNELESRVKKRIASIFRSGSVYLPNFNFIEAWNCKLEETITNRFRNYPCQVKCHFNSDLLVISNAPSELTPPKVCNILNIDYEPHYGASTVLSEDIILNVSKVKEGSE